MISIWLQNDNWASATTNYFLSANSNASGNGNHTFYIQSTNSIDTKIIAQAITQTNGSDNLSYNYSNTITQWHHILITHKRISQDEVSRIIYFDGINVADETNNYADLESSIIIGRDNGINPWQNDIDEFRFYNYALTKNQVYTLYNQGRR